MNTNIEDPAEVCGWDRRAGAAPLSANAHADERRAYVARLIAARCPEIGEAELARMSQSDSDFANLRFTGEGGELSANLHSDADDAAPALMVLPAEIGERILDVLAAVEQRLAGIEDQLLRSQVEGVA
jgi:hypothetical protein